MLDNIKIHCANPLAAQKVRRTDIFNVEVGKPRRLQDIKDDVLLFRVAYVPYVIGALAWDWTDSLLDQAAQMKISDTKPLARAIREIRKKYDDFRSYRIFDTMKAQELKHSEQFDETYADWFSELFSDFQEQIRYRYPKLQPKWVMLDATVYVVMVILRALFRYTLWCDREIEKVLGDAQNSILPQHFLALYDLIPYYLGDNDQAVRGDDLDSKVDELVNIVFSIEFTGEAQRCNIVRPQ